MNATRRALLLASATACGTPASPRPSVANQPAAPTASTARPWHRAIAEGVIDVAGDRLFAWDRDFAGGSGGVVEHALDDGAPRRTRAIAGLRINGVPAYWEPVAGGYLAQWDAPTLVREVGDRLEVAWTGAGDDWFDSHGVAGDALVIGLGRGSAAVARLSVATGAEVWRAPLVPWSQDVTVAIDGDDVYATWQEYDPQAPTPTVRVPRRVRAYDLATGRARWTYDLTAEPDRLVVHAGTIAIAWPDRFELVDGARGAVRATLPLRPLNASLLVDGDQVIALDAAAVVAVDLATGRERWRVATPLDGRPVLGRHGAQILVGTRAGALLALARGDGAMAWTLGLGVDPYRMWTTSAGVVVAAGGAVAGTRLPSAVARERAEIVGRVIDGGCAPARQATVVVDGAPVAIAADGRFAATVDARGLVRVEVAASPDAALAWEGRAFPTVALVSLDGHGHYDLGDLRAGTCGDR